MPIDVHAHYVPPSLLDALARHGAALDISLIGVGPYCEQCLRLAGAPPARPFGERLVEDASMRIAGFKSTGVDRQILSLWSDVFGYNLPAEQGAQWHRLANGCMSQLCQRHPGDFSYLASTPLQDAAIAARELEIAVREQGAIGGVVASHVEGVNIGERDLDEFWAAAVSLDVPIFVHPSQPVPEPRTKQFGLNQVVGFTQDTTLGVASLILSGVLDRFPELDLILSHGGGSLPYLIGRFDCLAGRTPPAPGKSSKALPSSYLTRLHYDSVLHDPAAIAYLTASVGADRVMLGTDDPFIMADRDPMATLARTGLSESDIGRIADGNARTLFGL